MVLSCVSGSVRELAPGSFALYYTCDGTNTRISTRGIVGFRRNYEEKEIMAGSYCHQHFPPCAHYNAAVCNDTVRCHAWIRCDIFEGTFINYNALEESERRTKFIRHIWRWIETTGNESGGSRISISTAQPADVFNPGDVHNAVNIELPSA
jgi:hypothetical protein